MLVENDKMKNADEFMAKLESDLKERSITDYRIIRLRTDLRRMSHDRESVERSKDEKRIEKFNNAFIARLGELSKLMQTTGRTNRDDVAKIVREVKAK
jgi:hypothetical protein